MKNSACKSVIALFAVTLLIAPFPAETQRQPAGSPVPTPSAPQSLTSQGNSIPAIRSSTNLVRIDVEVTDRSGKPVKDLRSDQFSVTDNGKPQQISIFSYSDIERIETATEETSQPIVVPLDSSGGAPSEAVSDRVRDRRMLVLYFDLTSMETDDLARVRQAALKFLHNQMTKADLLGVVAYSARLSVWADFTNDQATLEKAIARLTPSVSSQLADNSYAPAQNGEYDVQQYTGAAYTADETEFNVFNTDQKLAALQGLANILGAIPGRKAIIQFTSGITQTGEENRTQLRAATDAANRADVSIYSIDSRGLFTTPPGGDASTDAATGTSMFAGASVYHQTEQRQDSRDTLATLSSDTGGRAFFDLGDLSDAFPKIQQENTGYYLLGYYLGPNIKHDGSWRSVRVKVSAPGVRVRYRNGYYAPRDFQHLEKESRDQQLADAMHSENPVVELPIAVETSMFRLSDQQTYLPIAAKLSSSALDWAQKHGRREADFDFAAEVRAYPSGQSVAALRDTIRIQLDPQRFEQVNRSNLLYQGGVVLEPGKYRLKFLARENETGRIGTFDEDLLVPAPQPNRVTLSSVFLSNQLVPIEQSSEVQTKAQGVQAKIANSPLEMLGQRIVPSVTRVFTKDQTLYAFFQAYYPAKDDPSTLRAGLLFFRRGMQINSTPLLAPTDINPKTRTASFRMSLPLGKLPTGQYVVQAVVIGAGTQHAAFGRAYLALRQTAVAAVPLGPTP